MVTEQQWMQRPVQAGKFRVDGQFSGSVLIGKHYLDVILPLRYDLPISGALQMVQEIFEQDHEQERVNSFLAGQAKAQDKGDDGKQQEKAVFSHVWEQLKTILELATSNPPTGSGSGSSEQITTREGVARKDLDLIASRKSMEQYVRNDLSLKLEMEAKDNYLKILKKERDSLFEENASLKEEREHTGIGRFLGHLRATLAKDEEESDDESEMEREEQELENKKEHEAHPPKFNEDEMWLHGQFIGRLVTSKHFVDVHLPLKGVHKGVSVVKAMRQMCKSMEKLVNEEDRAGIDHLYDLLELEFPLEGIDVAADLQDVQAELELQRKENRRLRTETASLRQLRSLGEMPPDQEEVINPDLEEELDRWAQELRSLATD